MPWDQYNYTATPWAEIPATINEVGSIYTCQGFDLNYAGIIIEPPISQVQGQNRLQVNLDKMTDTEMFKKRTYYIEVFSNLDSCKADSIKSITLKKPYYNQNAKFNICIDG